jgi:hypothetical protein
VRGLSNENSDGNEKLRKRRSKLNEEKRVKRKYVRKIKVEERYTAKNIGDENFEPL